MRLLLVEDDLMIGESLRDGLHLERYAVDWVRSAHEAELAIAMGVYDLVVLDLGLPGKSGLDFLTDYRRRGGEVPVLIVTARDATADRISGLDSGADDYLVKPFDLNEACARIRAILRRRAGRSRPELIHGDIVLNLATREVTVAGVALHLSAREYSVLLALLDKPGDVVTKAALEEKLYGWGDEIESNTVEVYIHHLRKKLGTARIRNVRGVGYKMGDAG